MRIAWFSVFDEVRKSASPSAYFSNMVLPYFLKKPLVDRLEVDFYGASAQEFLGRPVLHYLSAAGRHAAQSYDVFFYQLEATPEARFMRMHLGLLPGVVLFHDFVMPDFGPEPIMNSPWKHIVRRFEGQVSDWPDLSAEQPQHGPYAIREASLSVVPIFTSEQFHADYKRLVEDSLGRRVGLEQGYFLPYAVDKGLFLDQEPSHKKSVAVCGAPGLESRSFHFLSAVEAMFCDSEAFADLEVRWLVGEEAQRLSLLRSIEEFPTIQSSLGKRFEILTDCTPWRWGEVIAKSSVAVHLRFSAYGQIGPYFQISQATGKPCIISDFGVSDYISDSLVYKVRPGSGETQQILEAVRLAFYEKAKVKGMRRGIAQERYDSRSVSYELVRILERSSEGLGQFQKAWTAFESEAQSELLGVRTARIDNVTCG